MRSFLKHCAKGSPTLVKFVNKWRASAYLKNPVPWGRGYSEYKWKLINRLLVTQPSYPFGTGLDERIIEIPWVTKEVMALPGSTLFDAGSALNFPTVLNRIKARFRITITTLYPERYSQQQDGISYTYEDLRNLSFRDDYFDIACSISTLEHIGCNNDIYKSIGENHETEAGGHLEAVREIKRVLKPRGYALFSMPFGVYSQFRYLQQFDQRMVEELVDAFSPSEKEIRYFKYGKEGWYPSTAIKCKDAHFCNIEDIPAFDQAAAARAIVLIKLRKK